MNEKVWVMAFALAIVLLLFGPSRLGGLGGAMGKAIRDFKDATKPEEQKAASSDKNAGEKS
jgi:sec-independent protein translocase protein TatA